MGAGLFPGLGLWLILAAAPPFPPVEILISGLEPRQGEILELTVIDDRVTRIAGTKRGKSFFFFPSPEKTGEWEAMIPFDLADEPGRYPLAFTIWTSTGREERAEVMVTLARNEFGRSELNLPRGQVAAPEELKARIAAERTLLNEVFGRITPEIQISGRFVLPFPGFQGRGFGEERILNGEKKSPHGGVDCGAAEGTTVSASNSGTVVLSRGLYYEGNAVIIDHGLGIYTFYLHLQEAAVTEGQRVERGDVIGWVGHTGRGTGPHLHFGLKMLEERVDPNQLWKISFD